MPNFMESSWMMLAGAGLTWLLFILGVAQLSRFYSKFIDTRKELDANMISLSSQLKKLQSTLAEIAIEQRRSTRLLVEQVDLKKAELTGDFEIVEEPVAPREATPVAPKPSAVSTGITLPDDK